MPMTPEDVRAKQFATVRMRTGYDMEEVDAFLDEIEAEVARLSTENERLRDEAVQARTSLAEAEERAVAAPVPAPSAAPAPPPGEQALKMLEMAQKTADDTVADARTKADAMLAEAAAAAEEQTRVLETERTELEGRVAQLRAFEKEYRSRLRSYLQGQLSELDGHRTAAPPAAPTGGPADEATAGAPQQTALDEAPAGTA